MNKELSDALELYKNFIIEDYRLWSETLPEHERNDPARVKVRGKMFDLYVASYRVIVGSRFLKVVVNNSVHSFINLKPDGKFHYGDILKAASYKMPAKNFARGNILIPDSYEKGSVTWTGAR